MSTAQLLALDTILPSLLAFGGLVFLSVALVPLLFRGSAGSSAVAATLATAVVGVACIAVGVALWSQLLHTQVGAAATPQTGSSLPGASASPSAAGTAARSGTPARTATANPSPTATLAPISAIAFQPDSVGPHDVTVAVEAFEHGVMLYRDDKKQLYVLLDNKTFKLYPDTWDETQPASGGLTPPPGKMEPRRGFGKLWRADPDVRLALGWATGAEAGMTGTISGDGSSSVIRADITYTLKKDGTYSAQ